MLEWRSNPLPRQCQVPFGGCLRQEVAGAVAASLRQPGIRPPSGVVAGGADVLVTAAAADADDGDVRYLMRHVHRIDRDRGVVAVHGDEAVVVAHSERVELGVVEHLTSDEAEKGHVHATAVDQSGLLV